MRPLNILQLFWMAGILISTTSPGISSPSHPSVKKMQIPLEPETPVSGSFAEYRIGHLHLGCDFKTYRQNGYYVLSPFSGYVSEIQESPYGYGLMLDIHSDSGDYKATFAHLLDLAGKNRKLYLLGQIFHTLMHGRYTVKMPENWIQVQEGERIARTGESGSGVSHLHFELRKGNEKINPLLFLKPRDPDPNPPKLLLLYVDSSEGEHLRLPIIRNEAGGYQIDSDTSTLHLHGKIRFKIGAYDQMVARNKNNVYRIDLYADKGLIFQRLFDSMTVQESRRSHTIYDPVRSSLSPPLYVYNLFYESQYSLDLNETEKANSIREIQISVFDNENNVSEIRFQLSQEVGKAVQREKPETFSISKDRKLQLDLRRATVYGNGNVEIEKVEEKSIEFPEGLVLKGNLYQLKTNNLSWSGRAKLNWNGVHLDAKENLYIYHPDSDSWDILPHRQKSSGIESSLDQIGILAILKDQAPPKIVHPYLITRFRFRNGAYNPAFLERNYYISDLGSGYDYRSTEVYLQGQPYPFHYEADRRSLILEIPKSFGQKRKNLLVEIRVKDYAGNSSEWFSDLVQFD